MDWEKLVLVMSKKIEDMLYILVTDVGSTTTKARLFNKQNGDWRFLVAGEAPTTVEAPYEDVTMGVRNAVREVEELTGLRILSVDGSYIEEPYNGKVGVDCYCTTSSAGGGLQMMVTGVVKKMTAESANRAALGAGAIVMDVISIDDGRLAHEKIRHIRNIRPDMILMAGGTDGGTISHVVSIAEYIQSADPTPRLGVAYQLPIVYAGNKFARKNISNILGDNFSIIFVDNIRPILEVEETEPARRAIHEVFMEHVMSHAPGYLNLMKWTDVDIMPTPAGEGIAMQLIADTYKQNVLGVGLGGATTNVYSIVDGRFNRSVSANLGMSYSITNVMKEAGIDNIMRWIPFDIAEGRLRNLIRNKMIRPTVIPQTIDGLIIEHAVAREALRLGLVHHKTIATRLKGTRGEKAITRGITTQDMKDTYIDMMQIDIIVGTGGLLSHAPRRVQSLILLADGFQPEGVTVVFQDSVFMMPHLGILSTVYRDAAWSIFEKDCLLRLGSIIAPKGTAKSGDHVMEVKLEIDDGRVLNESLKWGEIKKIDIADGQTAKATINPSKHFNIGNGDGKTLVTSIEGGIVGILLDGRGRPLTFSDNKNKRKQELLGWFKTLKMYPEKFTEDV